MNHTEYQEFERMCEEKGLHGKARLEALYQTFDPETRARFEKEDADQQANHEKEWDAFVSALCHFVHLDKRDVDGTKLYFKLRDAGKNVPWPPSREKNWLDERWVKLGEQALVDCGYEPEKARRLALDFKWDASEERRNERRLREEWESEQEQKQRAGLQAMREKAKAIGTDVTLKPLPAKQRQRVGAFLAHNLLQRFSHLTFGGVGEADRRKLTTEAMDYLCNPALGDWACEHMMGAIGGISIDKCVGQIVAIEKGGAYGSKRYTLQLLDGKAIRWENCGLYRLATRQEVEAFLASDPESTKPKRVRFHLVSENSHTILE